MRAGFSLVLWIGLLGASSTVFAQTLKSDSTILSQPEGGAEKFRLPGGSPVRLLKRQGFWCEIEAGGKTGWIKLGAISFGKDATSTAIDTGRTGLGNIVATSAARGLSARDLLEGKPNTKEVEKLSAVTLTESAIQTFKKDGGLQTVSFSSGLRITKNQKNEVAGGPATPAKPAAKGNKDDDW